MGTSWLFIGDDSAGCAHCGRQHHEHILPSMLCPSKDQAAHGQKLPDGWTLDQLRAPQYQNVVSTYWMAQADRLSSELAREIATESVEHAAAMAYHGQALTHEQWRRERDAMQSVVNAASIWEQMWSSETQDEGDQQDAEMKLCDAVQAYRAALAKVPKA